MCLYLYAKKIKTGSKLNKRFKQSKRGEITCWKVYEKGCDNELWGIHYGSIISSFGIVKSNRFAGTELTEYDLSSGTVSEGIHVFTTLKAAKEYINPGTAEVIVPVICKKSDLVAQGKDNQGKDNQAVFTKVRIRSRTWNKIFPKKL